MTRSLTGIQAASPPRSGLRTRLLAFYGAQGIRWARGALGLFLLALTWELIPRLGILDTHFITPLTEVLATLWRLIINGSLWVHVEISLLRSLAGFFLALVTAVPIGVAIAWYRPVADTLNPVLEIFRNTAPLALLPVFILVLGINETSKVAIIWFACFFPILLNTVAGVRSADPTLVRLAKSLGLSDAKLFFKVVLPGALPTVFTGIRLAGSSAILVLIAAEMVGANKGLGFMITYGQYNFLIPQMYAGILTISLIGLAINQALVALERRFSRWRD